MPNVINGTSTGSGGLITSGDDSGILNIQTNETTAMSIDASQSVDFTNNIDAPNTFGFKNRIINGAMVIDQRNAGASVTPTSSASAYPTDRFNVAVSQNSKLTAQQSATTPAGFINSLLVTSSSAYAVTTNDFFNIAQFVEGLNIADLAWGTASAATVTLSFKVYSSLTGTFGGALENSAANRCYPFSYTITSANTWTSISITIAGDTSGTWLTTNGVGIGIRWSMGAGTTYGSGTAGAWSATRSFAPSGSISVVGTSAATFYITGVQLEKGTQATSFDFRSYSNELAMCQRYFQYSRYYFEYAMGAVGSLGGPSLNFVVPMRASPTFTLISTAGSNTTIISPNANQISSGTSYFSYGVSYTSATTGYGYRDITYSLSAEL